MSIKKVLIIGAGFLQSFVIRKAHDMGYYTLTVDADPNAIGFKYADKYAVINIVDEKTCLEFAKQEHIDGVLTAATDYGELTASYIAQELGLPGLKYNVAQIIKNKYLTRKCLFENKVDDTEKAYEVDEDTNIDVLSMLVNYPVMVKPCDGSGSRGASRVDNQDDFKEACKLAMNSSITHRATVEQFIFGKEYGAESLVIDGEPHVLAIMRKWMTEPPYYAELGHAIPSDLSEQIENKAKECVCKALKCLGVNSGPVNMDMLITPNGSVHIVDVGARMGGNLIGSHIIKAGTGIDYMAAMIQNAVGDSVNLTISKSKAVATKLLALKPGKIEELPNFNELEDKYGVVIEHHMSVGDDIHEYHTNLDGCGYIVAVSDDIDQAVNKAKLVLKKIDSSIVRRKL